jgi:hypothetical protein
MNPQARVALLQALQDKKIAKISDENLTDAGLNPDLTRDSVKNKIDGLIKAAVDIGATGMFEKTYPHYAKDSGKVVKKLKPSEILDVVDDAFNKDTVVLSLTEAQFRKLGDEGSDKQRENIEKTLKDLAADPKKANEVRVVIKKLNRITSWADLGKELSLLIPQTPTPSATPAPTTKPIPGTPAPSGATSPISNPAGSPATPPSASSPTITPTPTRTEGGTVFYDDVVFQKPEEKKEPSPKPNKIEGGTAFYDDVVFQKPEEKKE